MTFVIDKNGTMVSATREINERATYIFDRKRRPACV